MYTMLAGQMATAERVHCVGCASSDQTSTHSYANVTQTPTGRRVALGSGLLRCAGCGGTMYLNRIAKGERSALYLCGRHLKGSPCTARGYTAALAHTALLAELQRLRGAPWTAEGEQHLLGTDSQRSVALAAIEQALNHERTALRTYVRGIALLAQDPTPEERVEFAAVRAEFTARVRALEAERAALCVPVVNITGLRALHERVTRTQVADLVDGLVAHDDTEGLRHLVVSLVASAALVERRPQSHPVWARAQVSWEPDVTQLLDADLLQVAEAEPAPVLPTSAELHRARTRRYRQRQREKRLAAQTGAGEELGEGTLVV